MASLRLNQTWPLPANPQPITLIGAGGIVNDAHLPAYRKAGFPVAGIYDIDEARARQTAERFGIERVHRSLQEAADQTHTIFDIAVPPDHAYDVLTALPPQSTILMQKPMGKDLADARRIRDLCRARNHRAAVNFQLRFAPMMLALRDAIDRGLLGQIVDVEFRLNLRTPWELFEFLKRQPRVEILVHSVHYLDLIRSVLGEPAGVWARTVGHPDYPELASTRTSIIVEYGQQRRVCLSLNHNYKFGPDHEAADVSIQGTRGAALVRLGLLLNYPTGKPETLQLITEGSGWFDVPIEGRWFPDGFVGTMANLQRYASGEDPVLHTHYEDAYKTMALVEACYISDASGATPVPQ